MTRTSTLLQNELVAGCGGGGSSSVDEHFLAIGLADVALVGLGPVGVVGGSARHVGKCVKMGEERGGGGGEGGRGVVGV